jgi:hypothetical protein
MPGCLDLAVSRKVFILQGICLQCVIEQDGEHKANGHANEGLEYEFNDGFKGHGIEIIETFAPGFKCWIADST